VKCSYFTRKLFLPEKWHHCISDGSEGTGPNGSGAKEGVEVLLPDLVRVGLGLPEVVRETCNLPMYVLQSAKDTGQKYTIRATGYIVYT
jgi:hypothetical protein